MKRLLKSEVFTTGLAIFSMFFGAGNLMFPIKVGVLAGENLAWGIAGLLITALLLPLAGLIAIILFEGDYKAFFNRLGKIPGFLLVSLCMLIIGPLIAMPRIVTLSYTMIEPFMPAMPLYIFTVIFLAATFFATYKENKIIDILGYIVSPLLLVSLGIIIIKGLFTGTATTITDQTKLQVFWNSLKTGYQTLDLLGGIFFAAIVISILKKNSKYQHSINFKELAFTSLKAGLIGTTLLGIIYVGLTIIGAYFGHDIGSINEGQLFSTISFRIMGSGGAAIIAIAVLMACYSTIVALAAVFAEFMQGTIFNNRINYFTALLISLVITCFTSNVGLSNILKFSLPLIEIFYPVLITLTLCNIAYKLFGMKIIKVPVLITLLVSIVSYYW